MKCLCDPRRRRVEYIMGYVENKINKRETPTSVSLKVYCIELLLEIPTSNEKK